MRYCAFGTPRQRTRGCRILLVCAGLSQEPLIALCATLICAKVGLINGKSRLRITTRSGFHILSCLRVGRRIMDQLRRYSSGASQNRIARRMLLATTLVLAFGLFSTCVDRGGQRSASKLRMAASSGNKYGNRTIEDFCIPCYNPTETEAADLDPDTLQRIQKRNDGISNRIEDYADIGDAATSDLHNIAFRIPKIIHQVWLGPAKPPLKLVDGWRYVGRGPSGATNGLVASHHF